MAHHEPGGIGSLLLVNGTFLFDRYRAGVQRYGLEVTRRIAREEDVRVVVPRGVDLAEIPAAQQLVHTPGNISQRVGPWSWIQLELTRAARTSLLWSPTNRAPVGVPRHVPTIHDVSVLDHPEWFRRSFVQLNRFYLPRLVRQAVRLITDSEFTKSRLLERFGVPDERVVVIRPGIDNRFRPASAEAVATVRERYGLPEQFVLSVGTIEPRKNLERLGVAWGQLPREVRRAMPLVLVGTKGRVFSSSSQATSLQNDGVIFTGYVDDADLPALYSAATVFAYPSLYEGFGFPPLEAMACGTPVVSSNVTATAEMLGHSAFLVDPTSTDDIRDGLLAQLESVPTRERFRSAGLEHVRRFLWEDTASRVLQALRDADAA